MTRTAVHPSWCAEGYRCTAAMPTGEHRSEPVTLVRAGRFAVVVSLVKRADRPWTTAEIKLSIRLRSRTPVGQVAELVRFLNHLLRFLLRLFRLPSPGGSR